MADRNRIDPVLCIVHADGKNSGVEMAARIALMYAECNREGES